MRDVHCSVVRPQRAPTWASSAADACETSSGVGHLLFWPRPPPMLQACGAEGVMTAASSSTAAAAGTAAASTSAQARRLLRPPPAQRLLRPARPLLQATTGPQRRRLHGARGYWGRARTSTGRATGRADGARLLGPLFPLRVRGCTRAVAEGWGRLGLCLFSVVRLLLTLTWSLSMLLSPVECLGGPDLRLQRGWLRRQR